MRISYCEKKYCYTSVVGIALHASVRLYAKEAYIDQPAPSVTAGATEAS